MFMLKNPIMCMFLILLGFVIGKCVKLPKIDAFADGNATKKVEPFLEVTYPEVIMQINLERKNNNVLPLDTDTRLICASQNHVSEMAAKATCDHAIAGGPNLFTRVRKCGYANTTVVELIACNTSLANETVEGWVNNPLIKEKMLDPSYIKIGCDSNKNYWACVLAKD